MVSHKYMENSILTHFPHSERFKFETGHGLINKIVPIVKNSF